MTMSDEPPPVSRPLVYGKAAGDVGAPPPPSPWVQDQPPQPRRLHWTTQRIASAVGVAATLVAVGIVVGFHGSHPSAGGYPVGGNATAVAVPHAGLRCPTEEVTAQGAPFCYALPAHFQDISATATYRETDKFRTMIDFDTGHGLAPRDLVTVVAHQSTINFDDYTTRELVDFERQVRLKSGSNGVAGVGPQHQLIRPRGQGRGVEWTVTYTSGDKSEFNLIYDADTVVAVKCQWNRYSVQIHAACTSVLTSLRVVAL